MARHGNNVDLTSTVLCCNFAGNSNVKNAGLARNEVSRVEALPPANRASPSEFVKWKGLTILQRKSKMPRIVKGEVMQACSSVKAKLVEINDDETPVERTTCEVVDLECDKQTCQIASSNNCFNTMGLVKKRKIPESQGSGASSSVLKEKGSGGGGGDKKEASASAFLSQVRFPPPSCFLAFFLYIDIFVIATGDL